VGSLDSSNFLLLFGYTLGKEGVVLEFLLLLYFDASALQCTEVTAASEADGSNETLDFRSLGVRFGILFLGRLDLPANDVFPDIVLLAQIEELPNLGRTLGSEPLGEDIIR